MPNSKIVFATPATRSMSQRPPLAFMYMASFLEKNGEETEIVDVKGVQDKEKAEEKTAREVVRLNPDIVGLTCLTPEVLDTRKLAERIKESLPDAKFLVGGVHPTLKPEDLLFKGSAIDYAVIGEGEQTVVELAKAIRDKRPVKKIRGIAFLGKNGKAVKTEPRPLITDLGELPLPAFDKVKMKYYTKPDIYCIRGIPIAGFYVFSSRGCPYRCEFCVNKNIFGRVIRFRKPESVLDEIELLVDKYKIDGFYMYDDAFTVNKKHVEAVLQGMKERKIDLLWGCETRVNLVYEDLMRKMKEAGCVQIDFGVESGSPENLVRLKKDITVPQIEKAFGICRKLGIRTFANFMINTPNETKEDVKMTIDLARRLDATINIFNVTVPYPGTDIYDKVGGVPLEDYAKIGPTPASYDQWIETIQSRYKLSNHNMDLKDLVKRLAEEFPTVHRLRLSNPKNFAKLWENLSFVFKPKYVKVMLKSKRKSEYLKWALSLSGYLKMQKNVVEESKKD